MGSREFKMHIKNTFVVLLVIYLGLFFSCGREKESGLELPEPTGPFGVGTAWFYLTDSSRPETFTRNPDDFRKIAVRVWYPAEIKETDQPNPYVEHDVILPAEGASEEIRASLEKLNERLKSIKTHSYKNASPVESSRPFPVVLYSHGYWAGMNQSTILMEELASRGYAAASIGHSFETNSITKPDGSLIRFDPRNPMLMLRNQERANALSVERSITQTTDPEELDALFHKIMEARPKMQESLSIWADDIRFAIDQFEELNKNHELFKNNLDLGHIGVMGHSFGGTASGQACLIDPRITAGINMDGLQVGDMVDSPVAKPFLFMHHDNPHAVNNTPNINLFQRARGPAYLMVIEGSGHYNFSDFSWPEIAEAAPVPEGALGRIDGERFIKILNESVLTFFDMYLKNDQSRSMKEVAQEYKEINLRINNIGD